MPTLVVQMGHTGRPPNPGSVGTTGEQEFARAVGNACQRLLQRGGWTVRLIIADPSAAEYRGNAFVAIHADGSTNPAVRGGSVGWQTPEGQRFANAWQAAYDRRGWPGIWQPDNYTTNLAQYYGVRYAVAQGNRWAFIAECGHLTSPDDRALMTGPGGYDRVALAIGDALGITSIEDGDDMFTESDRGALRRNWQILDEGTGFYESNLSRQLAFVNQQIWAGTAAVLKAINGQLDEQAILAAVDEATRSAVERGLETVVVPALREVLAQVLGDDNDDQAEAIVAALGERLRNSGAAA